jgi:hypothetical protein
MQLNQKLTPTIVSALQKLSEAFQPDELAYLALTQKVEHAIRDKLAFNLHQKLNSNSSLLVCREWFRRDLAIVQDGKPRLILEAKAIYTFDIIKSGSQHSFPRQVAEDFGKAAAWELDAPEGCPLETLALVIATHPLSPPNKKYQHAIKYFGGVTKYSVEPATFEEVDAVMQNKMQDFKLLGSIQIPGGKAFDTPVSVFCWLYSINQSNSDTE